MSSLSPAASVACRFCRSLHILKLYALCCFVSVLLLADWQPVQAQGGPPPNTGSWGNPTSTATGSFNYNYTYQGKTYAGSQPWPLYPSQLDWVMSDSGSPSHVDSQGTYTVTRKWSGPGPAPKTVYILETSRATGSGGIYGAVPGSGTAQDAFGDPGVPFSGGVVSSGQS